MSQPNPSLAAYENLRARLVTETHTWLVTGVAGFIGSNLLENLLKLNQRVVGLDNFATGHRRNLAEVQTLVTSEQWANFHFIEGDIRNLEDCKKAMVFSPADAGAGKSVATVEYVLHEAALGSVPRSLADPITTNEVNISGFLNMLVASRDAGVKSFTYAASSSTYGDHPGLPKVEHTIGKPLSPYAVTKYVNELYADVFSRCFEFSSIGLRYFNVFGKRQDPNGAYAAVIPKWIDAALGGERISVNGDGSTSRDFCFIDNVVQANLLAATLSDKNAKNQIYNIAFGEATSLMELVEILKVTLLSHKKELNFPSVENLEFRPGDVKHSLADITKARNLLGYSPTASLRQGIDLALPWYLRRHDAELARKA